MIREVKTIRMIELEKENKRLKAIILVQNKTINRLIEKFITSKEKQNNSSVNF